MLIWTNKEHLKEWHAQLWVGPWITHTIRIYKALGDAWIAAINDIVIVNQARQLDNRSSKATIYEWDTLEAAKIGATNALRDALLTTAKNLINELPGTATPKSSEN